MATLLSVAKGNDMSSIKHIRSVDFRIYTRFKLVLSSFFQSVCFTEREIVSTFHTHSWYRFNYTKSFCLLSTYMPEWGWGFPCFSLFLFTFLCMCSLGCDGALWQSGYDFHIFRKFRVFNTNIRFPNRFIWLRAD